MALSAEQVSRTDSIGGGMSKIDRYKWTAADKPGRLLMLPKELIQIDPSYQRQLVVKKVRSLARDWSWIALGAIPVARRPDGGHFAMDGQHRVAGSMLRSDVTHLPCIVFDISDVRAEAGGFLKANTERKPVSAVAKYRASLVTGAADALFVESLVARVGRQVSDSTGPNSVRCIGQMLHCAQVDQEVLERIWPLVTRVCADKPLHERILHTFFYMERLMPEGESLTQKKWSERLLNVGHDGLLDAMAKAAAFYVKGGTRIWAAGVLQTINKGRRVHLALRAEEE